MTTYPTVRGELETLQDVCAGRSLARYGDGEFALCWGHAIKCQQADRGLQRQLSNILKFVDGPCLIGIPNIRSETPKAKYWAKYRKAVDLLADRPYVSAFVSRPDSAPWIDTTAYWDALASLWQGQDVTLVRGSSRSLEPSDLIGARRVHDVIGPHQHAWSHVESIRARVHAIGVKRVLLCLGPTATVLAVDLAAHGFHAIDLGHIGIFLRKHRRGEPMVMTAAEHANDGAIYPLERSA